MRAERVALRTEERFSVDSFLSSLREVLFSKESSSLTSSSLLERLLRGSFLSGLSGRGVRVIVCVLGLLGLFLGKELILSLSS